MGAHRAGAAILAAAALALPPRSAASVDPEMSVAVRRQVARTEIGSSRGMTLQDLVRGRPLAKLGPGRSVVFESTREGIRASGLGTYSRLGVQPVTGSLLTVDRQGYRGQLRVEEDPFGRLNVVNLVPLEAYLRGVVAAEMLVSSPMEALKVQAVVARTFALKNRHRLLKERGFGLTADTDSQVYRGVGGEDPRTDQAVRETAGMVIEQRGCLVDVYYHQACGGRTQDNEAVWPGKPSTHLRAVDCPHCKELKGTAGYGDFAWTLSLGLPELRAKLVETGAPAGPIHAVSQTLEACGRAKALVVHHAGGELPMAPSRLRDLIGPGRVMSNHYRLIEVHTGAPQLAGGPAADPLAEASIRNIISGYISTQAAPPERIVLAGTGSGHGVGLCQWGARHQASLGRDFRRILEFYYQGVAVGVPTRAPTD